jgi:cytochrome c biogenesis protein CcmG, thiol:disulfide interchange protein DsbE
LPSTPSSGSATDDRVRRAPSRAAIALMIVVSIAIPVGLLAVILRHDDSPSSSTSTGVPTSVGSPTDRSKAKVGSPAPDFTLPTTKGGTVTLSKLRGRPVVLVFFASWCHPCEEELPVLEQLATDNQGKLDVVGVSFKDLDSDSVAFVDRLHVTFPAGLDRPAAPVAGRYGVRGIPQTVFIDANGIVRGRVYGETSRRALQPAVDDLLAGRDIRAV